jgi:hypothetical protein
VERTFVASFSFMNLRQLTAANSVPGSMNVLDECKYLTGPTTDSTARDMSTVTNAAHARRSRTS